YSCGQGILTNSLKVTYTCCTPSWMGGAAMPTPAVRAVGVFVPNTGNFYAVGGRSADTVGSDFTHPFIYGQSTNTWATSSATFPDNQVNNMACGLLTVSGAPRIYCVGGSAAGATTATARVLYYDPLSDTIHRGAAPSPG